MTRNAVENIYLGHAKGLPLVAYDIGTLLKENGDLGITDNPCKQINDPDSGLRNPWQI